MSTDEQDAILGRVVRELRDKERDLVAMGVKVSEWIKAFEQGARDLKGCYNPNLHTRTDDAERALAAVQSIPERADLIRTFEEMRETVARVIELRASRDAMMG